MGGRELGAANWGQGTWDRELEKGGKMVLQRGNDALISERSRQYIGRERFEAGSLQVKGQEPGPPNGLSFVHLRDL